MDYQEFKKVMTQKIRQNLDDKVRLIPKQITKNNGIRLDGLMLSEDAETPSPVVYLNDYYELWKKGMSMEELLRTIILTYEKTMRRFHMEPDFLDQYSRVREDIFYKIIHYEKNKNLLEEIPHRKILDLAMVFYMRICRDGKTGTILVNNAMMERWNTEQKVLEADAVGNSVEQLRPQLIPMEEILEIATEQPEDLKQETGGTAMYVLTNTQRYMGAGVLFYPEILRKASEILGETYYILPSSIHECILVPDSHRYDEEDLRRMVREVNRDFVDPAEVLSDQVYCYRKKENRICLI